MVLSEECKERDYGFNAVDCIRVFFEADSDHVRIFMRWLPLQKTRDGTSEFDVEDD